MAFTGYGQRSLWPCCRRPRHARRVVAPRSRLTRSRPVIAGRHSGVRQRRHPHPPPTRGSRDLSARLWDANPGKTGPKRHTGTSNTEGGKGGGGPEVKVDVCLSHPGPVAVPVRVETKPRTVGTPTLFVPVREDMAPPLGTLDTKRVCKVGVHLAILLYRPSQCLNCGITV